MEFALTTRYKRTSAASSEAQTSKAGQAEAQAKAEAQAREDSRRQHVHGVKGKSRLSGENGVALGTSKADLCVVATRPFKAGDLIVLCKGGVKDLTRSEDEALREEAVLGRERQQEQEYHGVLGQGRDFSVIRSARKGCSQLLLGPARFVNHDCDPNCQFHRLGHSQMVFRCLRSIGLNEEITTYYGDNYFEWANAECLCQTCEARGQGAFSRPEAVKMEESPSVSSLSEAESERQRRTSQRKIPKRSPPPAPAPPTPTTAVFEKNGRQIEKTFLHQISQREFDELASAVRGPKCTCLTCGSFFWAPETWWVPDECRRCERHYRIFKADWPGRIPTEGGWSARAKSKRKEMEAEAKAKKLQPAHSPAVSSPNSEADTPIKMSPLRETEPPEEPPRRGKAKARKRKRPVLDEGTDEDAIDVALRRVSPVHRVTSKRAGGGRGENGEDESDLTSVSEDDADEYPADAAQRSSPSSASSDDSSASKPSGPKMLGKEAKTETLAMFWGAASGDRRKRRQSNNGLESLSKAARKEAPRSTSLRRVHRRTASDISSSSVTSKTALSRVNSGGEQQQTALPRRESLSDRLSPQAGLSIAKAHAEDLALASPPTEILHTAGNISPARSVVGLATKGPERTSVKNLAMAWSAGVEEGGRGSRRKQPRASSQSSSVASTFVAGRRKVVSEKDEAESDGDDKTSSTKGEKTAEDEDERKPLPLPPAITSTSTFSPTQRSSSPANTLSHSPLRHESPLVGVVAPASSFASRPGAVPGQPIRKNLRWGSGKVSSSRPFAGPATSPLHSSAVGQREISASATPTVADLHGPTNGHGDLKRDSEACSPLSTKDRLSSPLARAALHASTMSSQMQNIASNGPAHDAADNDTSANGTLTKQPLPSPLSHYQRPASPVSLVASPLKTKRSSDSPGSQSPGPVASPLIKTEAEHDAAALRVESGRDNGVGGPLAFQARNASSISATQHG